VDAESLARPVVEGAGLELVEVAFGRERGRTVLRVVVDGQRPLDLDTIAAVSEKLSRRLDLEDFGRGSYELQVSSPGIERPLKTPGQFARAVGERLTVRTAAVPDGAAIHAGRLLRADEDGIVLEVDGAERSIAFSQIASARTVVDWAAELKGSNA
jgi:ribosome maturation factor RimP